MRILMICPDRTDATSFYRSGGVARDLQNKTGHEIVVTAWSEMNIHWQILSDFELIMLQRPYTKVALDLCVYAKIMNKPLWADYDDNLFALNPENRAFNTYNDPETQANIRAIMKLVDVVTVPTEYLRQAYVPYHKNIVVIPNAFNDIIFKKKEIKREKKVLWRGPDAHMYDLMTYGKALNIVTVEFPDWEFLFMGYYPWFLADTKNKGFIPQADIILMYKNMAEIAPEVMHVFLHDNTFNRCRSDVSFLEGSYAGAVMVIPSWWSLPGTLPFSNEQEYVDVMRSALKGEVDLEAMRKIAWEYILDCRTLSKINVERMQVINGLI